MQLCLNFFYRDSMIDTIDMIDTVDRIDMTDTIDKIE
jgi:hypothetical protein